MRSPMPEPLPFGRWLKRLRAERDLTQEALGEVVGCAPQTIRAFESGARRPSRELAERLAAVLDVPADLRADFVRAARTPASLPPAQPVAQEQDQPPGGDASAQGVGGTRSNQAALAHSPILTTKLYRPRPRAGLVSRPRLVAHLNAGLAGPLTIIAAPAGSGKTSLLADWLSGQDRSTRVAWLALDATDSDPAQFLRYLIAAFQTIDHRVGVQALPLLDVAQGVRLDAVLPLLVNDLILLPDPSVLVLDDYHLIDTAAVHRMLQFLLEHLPPQVHLVIASRVDPPLPLPRLRVRGQLTELRAQDLRFTAEEASTFLHDTMRLSLSPDDVVALETRTEGWIAGLQMAALSLQHRPPEQAATFIDAFAGSHRFVVDYLVEEVLARQPAHTQNFLLQTSILERLSGPLCDAVVLGDAHSEEQAYSQLVLDQIEHSNLFIIPLGDDRRWYRYHHLFADVLRSKLRASATASQVTTLYLRAAHWHEQHGMLGEAIGYALAAQEPAEAARVIEQHAMAMLEHNAYGELRRWLDLLPEEVIWARSRLCLVQGIVQIEVNPARVEPLLGRALALTSPNERANEQAGAAWLDNIPAVIAVVRGILAGRAHEYERAIALLQQVIPENNMVSSYLVGMAILQLGIVHLLRGALPEAEACLRPLLKTHAHRAVLGGLTVEAVARLGQVLVARGQLHEAARLYERTLAQFEGQAGLPTLSLIHLGLGDVYYEYNDLESADEHFRVALEHGERFASIEGLIGIYTGRARIFLAHCKRDDAQTHARKAQQLLEVLNSNSRRSLRQLPLGKILLALGDMTAVQKWVERLGVWSEQDASAETEQEQLVLGRVLLAQHNWPAVHDLSQRLLVHAEAKGRVSTMIEVFILQTLAHHGQEHYAEAVAQLAGALEHAAPEGYVRVFVDEGAHMAELLATALNRHEWGRAEQGRGLDVRGYAKQLLTAFEAEGILVSSNPHRTRVDSRAVHTDVDPLTERELQVLQLLALGHSNQAIAQQLVVAVGTVKRHVNSILSKLAVQSRLQAVARARELNLL